MRKLKNKEVIIGSAVLIVLCIIAIILIVKREFPKQEKNIVTVEEIDIDKKAENDALKEEELLLEYALIDESTNILAEENKEAKQDENIQMLGLEQFADSVNGYYSFPQYAEYTGEEMWQLEELFYYWDAYKLEAVDDLVRLPRLRTAFTNELAGTNQFYYYGAFNENGLPEGRGVSVYENNTYYCGEWKNGKRHGRGMWLQIYPDKPATLNGAAGAVVHSYNGEWKNDLPNGTGQEHFEYDLEELEGEDIILNVIGGFVDGYYDGELYIMTIKKSGDTIDWEANAQKGSFIYFHDRYSTSGKLPAWQRMEEVKEGTKYRWLDESENSNWGIFGLRKMN